jgi:autotransporter-associated beta strand protein
MFNKFIGFGMLVALFLATAEAKSQSGLPTDPSAIQSLYMNLSLRQLGMPNLLNDPYYFTSPGAPTQTWHTDNYGDMQTPVAYLGLCSLTNTEAVMQNLDLILQHTQINTGVSTFDPVFGMRYSNGTVATAYTNATTAVQTLSAPIAVPPLDAINVTTASIVSSGMQGLGSGTINLGGTLKATSIVSGTLTTGSVSLTKWGEGTLTLAEGNTYTGATLVTGGILQQPPLNLSGGSLQIDSGCTISLSNPSTNAVLVCEGGTLCVNNVITGSLIDTTTGTLDLSGPTDFAGTTSLLGGTLRIGTTTNLIDTIDFDHPITVNLTNTGAGTLTLGGTLTSTGNTTINQGSLSLVSGTTSTVSVLTGATLASTSLVSDTLTIGPAITLVQAGGISGVTVPEPGSFVLLAGGVCGLILLCRYAGRSNRHP